MYKNALLAILASLVFFGMSLTGFAASETTGQYVSNSAVTADVKAKLLADSDISSMHISVKTVNGKVTLTGTVATAEQKQKAETIASSAEGVKSVKNRLVIKPEAKTSDQNTEKH